MDAQSYARAQLLEFLKKRSHGGPVAGYQTIQRIGIPSNTTTLRIGVRAAATKLIGSTEIHLPLVGAQQ